MHMFTLLCLPRTVAGQQNTTVSIPSACILLSAHWHFDIWGLADTGGTAPPRLLIPRESKWKSPELPLICTPTNSEPLVAQTAKNPPVMQETQVRSLGQENPLEKRMAIHSSIPAWRIPWTEEPGGLQSMGSQRVGHDWVTNTPQTPSLSGSHTPGHHPLAPKPPTQHSRK